MISSSWGMTQPVSGVLSTISMDFSGPLPKTQKRNAYLLIAVKHMTGFLLVEATKDLACTTAVVFFEDDIMSLFGALDTVVTDNNPAFTAAAFGRNLAESGAKWMLVR